MGFVVPVGMWTLLVTFNFIHVDFEMEKVKPSWQKLHWLFIQFRIHYICQCITISNSWQNRVIYCRFSINTVCTSGCSLPLCPVPRSLPLWFACHVLLNCMRNYLWVVSISTETICAARPPKSIIMQHVEWARGKTVLRWMLFCEWCVFCFVKTEVQLLWF